VSQLFLRRWELKRTSNSDSQSIGEAQASWMGDTPLIIPSDILPLTFVYTFA